MSMSSDAWCLVMSLVSHYRHISSDIIIMSCEVFCTARLLYAASPAVAEYEAQHRHLPLYCQLLEPSFSSPAVNARQSHDLLTKKSHLPLFFTPMVHIMEDGIT